MEITGLYAGILGLLFFIMSIDTIRQRRSKKVFMGVGPNREILRTVSAHGNFSSSVPLLLIQLALLEQTQIVAIWQLHAIGMMFSLGRLFHFLAFRFKNLPHAKLRIGGMIMTFFPLVFMSIRNIIIFLR